jgi:hypothetical protein
VGVLPGRDWPEIMPQAIASRAQSALNDVFVIWDRHERHRADTSCRSIFVDRIIASMTHGEYRIAALEAKRR